MGDDVSAGRVRGGVGALVATLGLFAVFGTVASPPGVNPAGPRQVILTQVAPPAETSDAGTDAAAAATGEPADPGPTGDPATAAGAPPGTPPNAVAGAKAAATRPRSTAPTPPTPGTVEERGAAALALIKYPWERTGYSIAFTGPNDGLLGLTDPNRKQITIYVRPAQSTTDIARVLGHEIGHSVDFTMTTDAERADYRRIRGLDDRPWYPGCSGCSDYASPVGDWAETFAYWLLGEGSFASTLRSRPTAAQLTALTPIFTANAAAAPSSTSTTKPPAPTTTVTTAPKVMTPKTTPTSARPRSRRGRGRRPRRRGRLRRPRRRGRPRRPRRRGRPRRPRRRAPAPTTTTTADSGTRLDGPLRHSVSRVTLCRCERHDVTENASTGCPTDRPAFVSDGRVSQ